MGVDVNAHLKTARALPIAQPEDQDVEQRGTKFGDAWVVGNTSTSHPYADEGTYFSVTNPTLGTGLSYITAPTTFSDTSPFLYVYNQETNSNVAVPDVCLEQFKFIITAAPTGVTSMQFAIILDNIQRTFSTDNSPAVLPAVPNFGASPRFASPIVKVQNSATASVISASSASKRIIARGALGGLPILGDEYCIQFGRPDAGSYGATATASRKVTSAPAFEIAPQTSMVMHLWTPGGSAAFSFEFELTGWVR